MVKNVKSTSRSDFFFLFKIIQRVNEGNFENYTEG